MKKLALPLLSCIALVGLSACTDSMKMEIDENGRYWQRTDVTDAIYLRGPKAQQMLFQDMANCTATINEMQRLGAIRNAVPAETFNAAGEKIDYASSEGRLAKYDTPERDGFMRTEHYDYTDFEGCMTQKGWERTKFNDYATAHKARDTYLDNIGYEKYRSKMLEYTPKDGYND